VEALEARDALRTVKKPVTTAPPHASKDGRFLSQSMVNKRSNFCYYKESEQVFARPMLIITFPTQLSPETVSILWDE
jgi:hypothetical protein